MLAAPGRTQRVMVQDGNHGFSRSHESQDPAGGFELGCVAVVAKRGNCFRGQTLLPRCVGWKDLEVDDVRGHAQTCILIHGFHSVGYDKKTVTARPIEAQMLVEHQTRRDRLLTQDLGGRKGTPTEESEEPGAK